MVAKDFCRYGHRNGGIVPQICDFCRVFVVKLQKTTIGTMARRSAL
jgi:hypothetical protein